MKTRALEQQMARDGCVLEKKDGDHHVWVLPNGRRMVVPVGGKHTEAKTYLPHRYRRLSQGDHS